MFQSIIYLDAFRDTIHQTTITKIYKLIDTNFTSNLTIAMENSTWDALYNTDASIIPYMLIKEYKNLNYNVPKNVALFYLKHHPKASYLYLRRIISIDLKWIENNMFGICIEEYYQCILNQIKILNYTKIY